MKDQLKEMGLEQYAKNKISIKLIAANPDDVCSMISEVLYELIRSDRRSKGKKGSKKANLSTYLKAASLIRENYKIAKITLIKKDV